VACLGVVLPLAQWWAVEHRTVSTALHGECDVIWWGEGGLVSCRGTAVRGGTVIVACVVRAFSIHHVVVVRASEAPRVMSSGGSEAKASFPAQRREELLRRVLDHGPTVG
jgi:hypothetical protein